MRVTGVRTEDGETLAADLVIDATGRSSRMPALLREAGAPEADEQGEDSGFIYYTRFFRSPDGSTPMPRGPLNSPFESHSILTLPADGTLTGVALLADAWACTNPSVGRGERSAIVGGSMRPQASWAAPASMSASTMSGSSAPSTWRPRGCM